MKGRRVRGVESGGRKRGGGGGDTKEAIRPKATRPIKLTTGELHSRKNTGKFSNTIGKQLKRTNQDICTLQNI